jgi:hypothetical protein
MSETRAVAVLLWLFELARKGPRLKPSISAVYWGALVFLAALVLSVSLLAIQVSAQLAQLVATHTANPYFAIYKDFHSVVYGGLVSIAVTARFALLAAAWKRAFRLARYCLALSAAATLLFIVVFYQELSVEQLTILFLPTLVAAVIIKVTMGWWGLAGLGMVLLLSLGAWSLAYILFDLEFTAAFFPWSITSFWSSSAGLLRHCDLPCSVCLLSSALPWRRRAVLPRLT